MLARCAFCCLSPRRPENNCRPRTHKVLSSDPLDPMDPEDGPEGKLALDLDFSRPELYMYT